MQYKKLESSWLVKFEPRVSLFTPLKSVISTMLDKPYMHYKKFKRALVYNAYAKLTTRFTFGL